MKIYSTKELQDKFKTLGYIWPKGIHIIGIRAQKEIDNTFCDQLYVFDNDKFIVMGTGTTVPGQYWLFKPMNPKGTAIMVEGQYLNCWQIGDHHGYEALTQCAPIAVYRDSNRNNILDMDQKTIDRGIFAINIHRSAVNFIDKFIGMWSAGCQVWQDHICFDTMMKACKGSSQKYFSYTLLNES